MRYLFPFVRVYRLDGLISTPSASIYIVGVYCFHKQTFELLCDENAFRDRKHCPDGV